MSYRTLLGPEEQYDRLRKELDKINKKIARLKRMRDQVRDDLRTHPAREAKAKLTLRERHRKYREANREKRNEYNRRWRQAHPGYMREYRKANRERLLAQERNKRRVQAAGSTEKSGD